MHSDGSKKYVSGHSNKVKLEVMKEELGNCLSLSGYMASANVVQKYLEKRVFTLEQDVKPKERFESQVKYRDKDDWWKV